MRAFYANGVEKMHILWAVEGLPTLLHLSLFLFFGGLVIFLFNVDQELFICVVWWIGLFSVVYGSITLLPLVRQDGPYYAPLSIPAWFLYASIQYVTFKVLVSTTSRYDSYETWGRYCDLRDRFRCWMLGGVEKKAEESASEQSLDIDVGILGWTISALGDDDSLEKFFEALPGFFNSKMVNDLRDHLPDVVSRRLSDALHGFWGRTLTSNSVIDSVKLRRLDISMNAMNLIHNPGVSSILESILFKHWDQVPQTVEMGHSLARWSTSNDQLTAHLAQRIVSRVLATVRERDDRWVELAARVYGLSKRDLRDIIAHDHDSGSLAILIHLTRKALPPDAGPLWEVLGAFTRFDICNTLSELQHDFCTLWNEIVQLARKRGPSSRPVRILHSIRHLYITSHQGTDAAPIAFPPSTHPDHLMMFHPSSYPLCDVASHRSDSTAHVPVPVLTKPVHSPDASPHHSTSVVDTVSQQVNAARIIPGHPSPSGLKTPGEVRDISPAPTAGSFALPVHISLRHRDVSPPGAEAVVLQDISSPATLSHLLEENTQRDIVAPRAEPDVNEILSPTSIPASVLAPVPAPTPPVLNRSYGAGSASTSKRLLSASSDLSIPDSPPPASVPPFPNTESLALSSSMTPFRPTGNATLPRLRARGLVNTGNICFANAMLQLLVHSPPFWDLFRELGDLTGQRGAGGPETGGSATPLLDATIKFSDEFVYKEELSMTEQLQQKAVKGKAREDEEEKKQHNVVDSFNPRYMYNAMREKKWLKDLLVCSRDQVAPFCYRMLICAGLMCIGWPTAGC